jgi:hypothetical protein
MATNQDRLNSGILKHKITLGLNICTRNMRFAYGNGIPWGKSKLPNIWIRGKYITLGHHIYTQNIWVTCENNILRGQIVITRHLGSYKVRLHWAPIFVPLKYEEYKWKKYFMWTSQYYPKAGFAENPNIFTRSMRITHGKIFHVDKPRSAKPGFT